MSWEYKREEQQFEVIPEGDYRIRIKSADKAVSKSGNDMLALQFEVSGKSQILYHYIVFLDDRPEITNRMLTQFFDSFKDINDGDFNINNWIGKVGGCHVKHDEYNGNKQAKIGYFLRLSKQDELPPWQEPKNSESTSGKPVGGDENGFVKIPDEVAEGLPFF